jgi:hypothetical protein
VPKETFGEVYWAGTNFSLGNIALSDSLINVSEKKNRYLNIHLLKTDDDDDQFLATPKFNGHNGGWYTVFKF